MKKYLAEFIGTFSLVLFGCGAAVIAGNTAVGPSGIGLLGISIAFGFAVVAMAYAIGGISGCHGRVSYRCYPDADPPGSNSCNWNLCESCKKPRTCNFFRR